MTEILGEKMNTEYIGILRILSFFSSWPGDMIVEENSVF